MNILHNDTNNIDNYIGNIDDVNNYVIDNIDNNYFDCFDGIDDDCFDDINDDDINDINDDCFDDIDNINNIDIDYCINSFDNIIDINNNNVDVENYVNNSNNCLNNNETQIIVNNNKYRIQKYINNWLNMLDKVKKYIINVNNKVISYFNNDEIKKLHTWIIHQKSNYKKTRKLMKIKQIYDIWTQFINDPFYDKYFKYHKSINKWLNMFNKVKEYIKNNNKKPSLKDDDKEINKMCRWIKHQQTHYNNKKYLMSVKEIYDLWNGFINNPFWKQHFNDKNINKWLNMFNKVKEYIKNNNKKPSLKDNDNESNKMGRWIEHQQTYYNNKKYLMSVKEIYDLWNSFINHPIYKQYSNYDVNNWLSMFNKVKEYIDNNKKKPSRQDDNNEVKKLNNWIFKQQTNYNCKRFLMCKKEIYNLWHDFINNSIYNKYFNNKSVNEWLNMLNKVKDYINVNNTFQLKDKLHNWFNNQKINYAKKKNIMKHEIICNEWINFINDFNHKKSLMLIKCNINDNNNVDDNSNSYDNNPKKYYKQYFYNWLNQMNKLKHYIDVNNEIPSTNNYLNHWFFEQKKNFKNINYVKKLYNIWTNFINDPKYTQQINSNNKRLYDDKNDDINNNFFNDNDKIIQINKRQKNNY